jgi:hypothetical protein
MLLIIAKSTLTPLLLVFCTFVSNRWGDSVSGWLLGLPLASGPISVFLELEHGRRFAWSAAQSTLLGFVAVGVFCLTYLALARRRSWRMSLAGSAVACLATTGLLSFAHLTLVETFVAVAVALVAMNFLLGDSEIERTTVAPKASAPGIAVRMVIAGGLVLALSTCSGLLGGNVSGLLAPLPVLAALMAVTAHRRVGLGAAQGLLRGIVVGMWGGVAFFAAVAVLIYRLPVGATYAAAVVCAGLVGWAATRVAALHPRLRLQKHFEDAPFLRSAHRGHRVGEPVALCDQCRRVYVPAFKQA